MGQRQELASVPTAEADSGLVFIYDSWSRLMRSQKRLRRHTRPTPACSSHRLTPSPRSRTRVCHTSPRKRRSPSLSLSFSTARFVATKPGAKPQCRHSWGSTPRSTRSSADGRRRSRLDRRMETKFRARCREILVVLVRKMALEISSAREGREGEKRSGGSTALTVLKRDACRTGSRERLRRWRLT